MMRISKTLQTAALAGVLGLGMLAATTTPAKADRAYTRCDRDGDRCWRVVCDWDGDDCHRYAIPTRYRDWRNGYYRDRYNSYDRYYDRGYYDSGYRRWVCDRDGDRCYWSYRR